MALDRSLNLSEPDPASPTPRRQPAFSRPGATHGAWGCSARTPSRGDSSSSKNRSSGPSWAPHIFPLRGGAAPGEGAWPGPGLASREGGLLSLVKLYVRTDHRV